MLRRSLRQLAIACDTKRSFDVCVLGGGPAGIAAALRAVDFGKRVCIVEKNKIGGQDFYNGTLQTKMLWEMAKFNTQLVGTTGTRFLDISGDKEPQIDQAAIRQTILNNSRLREKQVRTQLDQSDVDVLEGQGTFTSPNNVEVMTPDGAFISITADYFVIATGSQPKQHPQYPSDGKTIVTSDELLKLDMPKSLVIIGAGVVGCEFATMLANFGLKVNVIEKRGRILPMEDEDVGVFIQDLLKERGVTFHSSSSLRRLVVLDDGRVSYTIRCGEESEQHVVDKALISIGRKANYSGLGLELLKGKVQIQNERLVTDKFGRCEGMRHVYVCGDAIADKHLVNIAEHQGRMCVEHMYSSKPQNRSLDGNKNLGTILFLDQEVAAVGMNELECREKKIAYKYARHSYQFVSRAIAMNNTRGFVKIIVTNDREKIVLGVRAVGPHASSVVELASLAIANKQSAYQLADLLTAYPAVTQGFQECTRMILGRSLQNPDHFGNELAVDEWDPDFQRGRAYQSGAAE
jgi:dihydrolipoamide dehydrogenase